MKNYKLVLSYDGTRYYGWEHQPDRDTIQGKLESVLSRMCGAEVEVIGAGRTDAGVHAKAMTANAWMQTDKTAAEIRDYLNRYLPDDISVSDVREASERFHARYKAVGKTYSYTCFDGAVKPVFNRRYLTRLDARVNIEPMVEAAKILQGEHDFRSFCGNPKMKKSTVRIVDTIEVVRKGDYIYFNFHGTGFLQNMVRILVGTLLEVGYGRLRVEQIKEILDAKDRRLAGPTAPPEGLCLVRVDY